MDKRNQMENPFFDPDKPGSIFVGMDRYHQYSPHQPRNALTFIQKGDADSLFRKFLIDNIKEAECCPYIPDTELLRFDLANMRHFHNYQIYKHRFPQGTAAVFSRTLHSPCQTHFPA